MGLDDLKNRFVRHVRARSNVPRVAKAVDVVSVVRKEVGADGVVRLKEESFNYNGVRIFLKWPFCPTGSCYRKALILDRLA